MLLGVSKVEFGLKLLKVTESHNQKQRLPSQKNLKPKGRRMKLFLNQRPFMRGGFWVSVEMVNSVFSTSFTILHKALYSLSPVTHPALECRSAFGRSRK